MEARTLASFGKISGLAGLALGVFILIFRDILSIEFLPSAGLDQYLAFSIIMSAMIITFGISGVGVIAWLIGKSNNNVTSGQIGALLALILVILFFAVYVIDKGDSEKKEKERIASENAIAKNYALMSTLSNMQIKNYALNCQEYYRYYSPLEYEAPEIVKEWRDSAKYQRTFYYEHLRSDLQRLIAIGADKDPITASATEKENAILDCITEHVKGFLGMPPLIN